MKTLFERVFNGSDEMFAKAEEEVNKIVAEVGRDAALTMPSTAYFLACIYAYIGKKVTNVGELQDALADVKAMMLREPRTNSIFQSGVGTAIAAEMIEACKYVKTDAPYEGTNYHGHFTDAEVRELGVPLVTGDIPGFVVMIGPAPSTEEAVETIKGYQSRGIFVFLIGGIIEQAVEAGLSMGFPVRVVPVGEEIWSVGHVISLVVRAAMIFGAIQPGDVEGFHFVWAKQPKADDGGLGARKKGCSTILIAGTDEGGYRTDTMMLFSVDREAKTMSLVSIPRDTLVYCEYSVPKLNSAYGWAGGGDDGMQELLTRVEEIVGFRPDGYVVTDLACFEELVDLMGGVTFDVPVEMHYNDPSQNLYIDLSAGEQKLDGAQAMQVMRFRSGYADADLGRVKVQRDFLAAALHQWASVKNAYKLPSAIRLITEHTKTDLTSAQLAWLAESAALCGTDGLTMATMPGSAAWIGGGSYYVLDAAQVADLVNEKLNPYQKEVTVVDLAIRAG